METMTIDTKKERLEREKARIASKEQKIKALERKKELKKTISLGQMLIENGLDILDSSTLLGALLELKERSEKSENLEFWNNRAKHHLEENKIARSPVIVTFQNPPDKETRSILRDNGLKWNPFRKEWQGYSHIPSLKDSLANAKANIQVVQ